MFYFSGRSNDYILLGGGMGRGGIRGGKKHSFVILHFRVSCRLTEEMDNTDNESHKTLAAIADD